MTIAVGMMCGEGIVICADMEQTLDYVKMFDGKVTESIFFISEFMISIAGAGHGEYIDAAKMAILSNFPQEIQGRRISAEEIEKELRVRTLDFFKDHLLIFSEKERPELELLIGVVGK